MKLSMAHLDDINGSCQHIFMESKSKVNHKGCGAGFIDFML